MHSERTNARPMARRIVAGGATIAAILAVAGCSGEDIAEKVAEKGLEAQSGDNVDIDLEDGSFRVQTEDGSFEMRTDEDGNISISGDGIDGEQSIDINSQDGATVIESDEGTAVIDQGGTDVPDDFPTSVPLPDGFSPQYTQSMSSPDGNGWILGGETEQSAADFADSYFAALEAAGFERQQVTETPDSVIFGFDDGEYSVTGLAGDDGSGTTYVNLTVADSQL